MSYIGITLRELKEDNKIKEVINQTYIKAMNKYNLTPIFLSATTNNLNDLLKLCDGFIITGGDDVNPKYYNEKNISSIISDLDDALDKKVVDYAVKNTIPMLGICRGIQSINVFLGGSLHQHIDDHFKSTHKIYVNKNTLLGQKLPENFIVNSYHHQSIKNLGNDLIIVATSKDSQIEIIEHKNKPLIGVQYHPELNDFREDKYIFEYFITLISAKKTLKNNNKIYPFK